MGLIKMSGFGVTELSGKVGGNVGARNRAGMTLKVRTKGTNAKTNKQITQRGKFSNNSAAWRGLTQAERNAWITAAASGEWPYQNKLGETRQPSGSQLYNQLNGNIILSGGTVITAPPLKTASPTYVWVTITLSVGGGSFSYTDAGTLTGDYAIVLYSTPSLSPGIGDSSVFRFIDKGDSFDDGLLYGAYVDVFGTPTIGASVQAMVVLIDRGTGQRVTACKLSTIVVS